MFEIEGEDAPDQVSLALVDHQQLVLDVVAQRRQPRAPQTLAGAGEMKILGPLHVHLPVVLRELNHNGRHQAALRAFRIDRLRGRDEGDVALLEKLQQIVEVLAVTREAVQLVDDNTLNPPFLHGLQETLDGGTLEILAGLGRIVESLGVFRPTFFPLDRDVAAGAGLLVIKRGNGTVEIFVVAFPRVDRDLDGARSDGRRLAARHAHSLIVRHRPRLPPS
ncbi:MAG: hypothetical protein A2X40_09500 [Elusimicrobia bacterium GWC2_65_9]|nr:MAG: hypothetical protein A2X37_00865 [Elusimicrobia bacterium GWA2_66_18]OGR70497.1 MAG: hypothetical protein A2X40_09500 [Elusimicrobia bacterium GWC2_65_9]